MALWQFELDPIPSAKANIDGVEAIHLDQAHLDSIELGLSEGEQRALFSTLATLLPEKQSWSDRMRIWGDEKSDDIQVFFDGSKVELVQIRLDVANLSIALVGGICALAHQFRWVFATRLGAVIQPTREAVIRAIVQSPASKFVRDPLAYIELAVRADNEPP